MEHSDSDRALAEQIEVLLDVEPLPDFRARIRQRVEAEASKSARRTWLPATVAAVAASVVIVAVMVQRPSPAVLLPRGTVPQVTKDPTRPALVVPEQLSEDSARALPARAPSPRGTERRQPAMRTDASEVIISADDAAGVDALLSAVRSGHIWVEIVPDADTGWSTDIEPIRIEPLRLIAPLDEGPL